MIITIDGPAGAGKSTAARGLAARLGFEFLDTGAMYRMAALVLDRAQIPYEDEVRVTPFLAQLRLEIANHHLIMNGEDLTEQIRTPERSMAASLVAVYPHVRRFLVKCQREIASTRRMVSEGRDQGTAAFPDALCKFFLTATVEARAERRYHELIERGVAADLEEVKAAIRIRDKQDSERVTDPLTAAPDAIIVDSSNLTSNQVLDRLEKDARRCLPG